MTAAEHPTTRHRRRILRSTLIGFSLLAIMLVTGLYLTSDSFQNTVRKRLVAELERVTGARVEIKHFQWNVSKLEVQADDVTLHGLEGPGDVPYAHADRLYARAKILSFFGREIGLRAVRIERPVVHIIVFPDGSTNQPVPKIKTESQRSAIDRLFDLAIDRAEVVDGQLILNDRRVPFDFAGNDVSAHMTYALLARRYDGSIKVGQMDTQYKDFQPLRSKAELDFSLGQEGAEIKQLSWQSPKSKITASGRMTNYSDPKLDVTYSVDIDLAEVGAVSRTAELRGGRFLMNGQGTYTVAEFTTAGHALVQNAAWIEQGRTVPGFTGTADYSGSRERISVSNLHGTIYGGRVTGSADVYHWSKAAVRVGAKTQPTAGEPQRGSASFQLAGVSLGEVAAAFSSARWPLQKVQAAGAVGGTIDAKWTGRVPDAEVAVALDVAPPANPRPEQVPVNARVRLAYFGATERLRIDELSMATRSTRLNAAGELGSANTRVNVAVNTNDLSEFRPALLALRHPGPLPVDIKGKASFTGRMFGRLRQPSLAGHIEIADFDSTIALPQVAEAMRNVSTAPRNARVHWDLLTADVEYAPALVALHHAELTRGNSHVGVELSAQLRNGGFDDGTVFQVSAQVRGADLADLQTLLGYDYPVSGTVSAELRLRGTARDLSGGGTVRLVDGAIWGEPFQSLHADLEVAGTEGRLRNLVLTHDQARITGSASYDPTARTFAFDVRGAGWELGDVQRLHSPRVTVQGTADFAAQGSGSVDAPQINAQGTVHQLVVNGEPVGEVEGTAVTHGADMHLDARAHHEDAVMQAVGDIRLRDDYQAGLHVTFNRFDIDPVLRAYLGNRVTGHSQVDGTADLSGPLARPRLLHVEGNIARVAAEIENVHIASDGPVRFSMADEVLRFETFRLKGDHTDLTAGGTIALAGTHALSLRAAGHVNLQLVQTFNQDLTGSGEMTMELAVTGDLQKPQMQGRVEIRNAGVSYVDLPNGLSDINGSLVFNENRLQVETLTARSGGGALSLGGSISYANGLYFDLTATSGDIRLRYPPGVSAVANANLRFVGTTANALLSGDITVTRFGLNPRFDFASYLERSKTTGAMVKANSPLNNLRFDVHIVSTPELQVETGGAKVSGNVDLHLRGTAAQPVVLGRVNVIQGDVFFNGTQYRLERGDITFTNPVHIEPVFNVEASARVRDYDITIGLHGTTDRMSVTYRSDPPLPTGDIIALIALGRTQEDTYITTTAPTDLYAPTPSSAMLGEALNATISSRSQKLFGLSRVKIDPAAGGPEANPNARVTIEQQVSDKVTLTYITNLTQSAQQIIQVEYNINRNVSIVAVRDQNGVVGFDVKLRQRKR